MSMTRTAFVSLLLLPLVAAPAAAERFVYLASPAQELEGPPLRPVGDPDTPPISIDLFELGSARDEAAPWPLDPAEN
jgi:hypothetical protein